MGQCIGKCKKGQSHDDHTTAAVAQEHASNDGLNSRLATVGFDIEQLILETLAIIRTLVNNEQEPPSAMMKLNVIAEKDTGWLLIMQKMVEVIPLSDALGPAVITLFVDESALPTRHTVSSLLARLALPCSHSRSVQWHRNTCLVLACIAEKLAGENSAAIFEPSTMHYLISKLNKQTDSTVALFALIALEKFAQTTINRELINERLLDQEQHPLRELEQGLLPPDWQCAQHKALACTEALAWHQVAFCAQSALDNIFVVPGRTCAFELANTQQSNALLNQQDVSEYLKIAPTGLEARCDVISFESVRCTYQIEQAGLYYYEVLLLTAGVMQIGWATKHSKFFNHEGYGIGDDEFSVGYDGCRQFVWHAAKSNRHTHPCWQAGDTVGCALDSVNCCVQFSLNGVALAQPHTAIFNYATTGFLAAASFMSFQQCRFNFGSQPFLYAPNALVNNMNELGQLTDEQRLIRPRRRQVERVQSLSLPENSCQLCYTNTANTQLWPCAHSGFCSDCAMQLEICPLCRADIQERLLSTHDTT